MYTEQGLSDAQPQLSQTKRALLEKRLRGGTSGNSTAPAIGKRPQGSAPLSFSQQRLWFLDRLEAGNLAYHIPTALRLQGRLDIRALEQAVNEMIRRHEILRTRFGMDGEQPVQIVAPELRLSIGVVALSELAETDRDAEVLRLARADGAQFFDLTTGPLLRVNLLVLGEQEYVLLFTLHHIVFDGWSAAILFEEFASLYQAFLAGNPSPLSPLPIQYADFAYWQRQWLQG